MENPASWTETTHAIQTAIVDHKAAQDAGAIGGSLAMYIETVVFEPRMTVLTQERDGLLKLLTNCRNGLELLLAEHAPEHPDDPWDTINELRETVRKSTEGINAARAALAAGPRGEET